MSYILLLISSVLFAIPATRAMTPLLAQSGSSELVQIVTIVTNLIAAMFSAFIGWMMFKLKVNSDLGVAKAMEAAVEAKKAAVKGEAAAVKVEEVRTTLKHTTRVTDTKLDNLTEVAERTEKKAEDIYLLSNSAMGAALLASAGALRTVANMRPTPENNDRADEAEAKYRDHQVRQKTVDSGSQPGSDVLPASSSSPPPYER